MISILPEDRAVVLTYLRGCAWVSKAGPTALPVMCCCARSFQLTLTAAHTRTSLSIITGKSASVPGMYTYICTAQSRSLSGQQKIKESSAAVLLLQSWLCNCAHSYISTFLCVQYRVSRRVAVELCCCCLCCLLVVVVQGIVSQSIVW